MMENQEICQNKTHHCHFDKVLAEIAAIKKDIEDQQQANKVLNNAIYELKVFQVAINERHNMYDKNFIKTSELIKENTQQITELVKLQHLFELNNNAVVTLDQIEFDMHTTKELVARFEKLLWYFVGAIVSILVGVSGILMKQFF